MMRYLTILILALSAFTAQAADIQTSWTAVVEDAEGNPLPTAVSEYRVYDCLDTLIATVPGDTTQYLEVDAANGLTSGTSICRRVTAFLAPFEGPAADGVFIAVIPGQTTVTTSVVN